MSTRTIKKYPNRRLYDTELSHYITVSDLRQLIVEGEEFIVIDVASGDNITRSVLPGEWGWVGPGPGHGIQLRHGRHAGRLVIPAWPSRS